MKTEFNARPFNVASLQLLLFFATYRLSWFRILSSRLGPRASLQIFFSRIEFLRLNTLSIPPILRHRLFSFSMFSFIFSAADAVLYFRAWRYMPRSFSFQLSDFFSFLQCFSSLNEGHTSLRLSGLFLAIFFRVSFSSLRCIKFLSLLLLSSHFLSLLQISFFVISHYT